MVNNWDSIYVERSGKLFWTGTKFHEEGQLRGRSTRSSRRSDGASTRRARWWTRGSPTDPV